MMTHVYIVEENVDLGIAIVSIHTNEDVARKKAEKLQAEAVAMYSPREWFTYSKYEVLED
jgi:putative NIF3 family GTP cyclohydrolase 1 type 2